MTRRRTLVPPAKPVGRISPELAQRLADGERRLTEARRAVDRNQGRKETLDRRLAHLTEEVGLAKGRLLLKPQTDEFLQAMQANLHRRAVGSYERMLTAIVQDVLKTDDRVGLDLTIERGLPALDIFLDAKGNREDIMNGAGGSVTNVISLGLRMITTVRSGGRRFVALDEPDCWLQPSKVKAFYNVIDGVGGKLGMQSLIISHHDLDLMPEGLAVARLHRQDGRVVCENDPKSKSWQPDQEGIRVLRIRNMMSHSDTEIRLAPGATAIIGDNHLGKSVSVRALRAVCYGEAADTDIRHGEKSMEIELEIEGNRKVRFTREPKRNPVNQWTLETLDGDVITDEATNTEFRSGGRSTPDWVTKVLRIERFEGLEHQLSHQKTPVFLLNETASKRAAVLSIGRESGYIQKMLNKQRENAKADASLIKKGEQEVAQIQDELALLEGIEAVAQRLEKLAQDFEALKESMARTATAEVMLDRFDEVAGKLAVLEPRLAAARKLTAETPVLNTGSEKMQKCVRLADQLDKVRARLDEIEPRAVALKKHKLETPVLNAGSERLAACHRIGRELVEVQRKLAAAEARAKAAKKLPKEPKLSDQVGLEKLLAALERNREALDKAEAEQAKAAKERKAVDAEMKKVVEELGGVCPLCSSNIKHTHIKA